MSTEFQLFDGKNLSSLFKDIYENQQNKKKNISELIESLRKLIKNVGEATVIAPIIKDLIEVNNFVPEKNINNDKISITFVGHSTFLIQFKGLNILTDPIWSNRASPVSIDPEGEWPNYVFRWDNIAPGRSAKVRFVVNVDGGNSSDYLLISSVAVLDDGSEQVLVAAEPYSVGLKD